MHFGSYSSSVMRQRLAWAILSLGAAVLAIVGAIVIRTSGDGRVDLVGPEVRTTTVRQFIDVPVASPVGPATTKVSPNPPATPTTTATTATTAARRQTAAVPRRLTIPTLGVDATVVSVGKNPDGSMQIPGGFEAGWYQPGPRPGDSFGSAVIAAHVDHAGSPGIFIDLARLELGTNVEVSDQSGDTHRFVVTERFQVDKDLLPSSELFRSNGSPTLTLITCGGSYDRKHRHYADNIVIRAVPVGPVGPVGPPGTT